LWYIIVKDRKSLKEWFFMHKTFKILGVFALAIVIGFSMAACNGGDDGPDPNIITITDIPSIFVGKVGALMLSTSTSAFYQVYSIETINGTSFSFPMRDWIHDSSPWDGSGSFGITIFMFDDIAAARNGNYIYAGVIPGNTEITEQTTTLEWSSFVRKAGLNYQIKIVR
jgi:hypothetical protein